ncbi:hypothetical protein QBC43DRAFT_333856 [Cladorrhinum sp. PSN259]|nr:hypothetical protein QBC43DRAFT_333856 [Cladorrhinum sp. PSN259]
MDVIEVKDPDCAETLVDEDEEHATDTVEAKADSPVDESLITNNKDMSDKIELKSPDCAASLAHEDDNHTTETVELETDNPGHQSPNSDDQNDEQLIDTVKAKSDTLVDRYVDSDDDDAIDMIQVDGDPDCLDTPADKYLGNDDEHVSGQSRPLKTPKNLDSPVNKLFSSHLERVIDSIEAYEDPVSPNITVDQWLSSDISTDQSCTGENEHTVDTVEAATDPGDAKSRAGGSVHSEDEDITESFESNFYPGRSDTSANPLSGSGEERNSMRLRGGSPIASEGALEIISPEGEASPPSPSEERHRRQKLIRPLPFTKSLYKQSKSQSKIPAPKSQPPQTPQPQYQYPYNLQYQQQPHYPHVAQYQQQALQYQQYAWHYQYRFALQYQQYARHYQEQFALQYQQYARHCQQQLASRTPQNQPASVSRQNDKSNRPFKSKGSFIPPTPPPTLPSKAELSSISRRSRLKHPFCEDTKPIKGKLGRLNKQNGKRRKKRKRDADNNGEDDEDTDGDGNDISRPRKKRRLI